MRVIRIGRDPDNDVVLSDPRVSGHHARLLVVPGSKTLIEDLGSSNGTFLNSPDRRITQAVPLSAQDVVYFGSLAISAVQLLNARSATENAVPPTQRQIPASEPPPPVLRPSSFPPLEPPPVPSATATPPLSIWSILLLAQAPVLAILILLVFGRQAASAIFAMAIAAVWLGGSLAVWACLAGGPSGPRKGSLEAILLDSPVAKLITLVGLCIVQCALLLAIVHWGSGLRGDWPAMFGVLVMASAVGLVLGLAVFFLIRAPMTALVVLLLGFLPMIAFCGWIRPSTSLIPVVRPLAALMPTRWAFEGLLLIESERRPAPREPAGPGPIPSCRSRRGLFPGRDRADGHHGGRDGPGIHAGRAGVHGGLHFGASAAFSMTSNSSSRFRGAVSARRWFSSGEASGLSSGFPRPSS